MASTSIQYHVSNTIIAYEVIYFSRALHFILDAGPEIGKEYLLWVWESAKDRLNKNPNINLVDADKKITKDSFNIEKRMNSDNSFDYLITFPDYEYRDATAKYGLIHLDEMLAPAYFTLEYSKSVLTNEPNFVVGRWVSVNGEKKHVNLGFVQTSDPEVFIEKAHQEIENHKNYIKQQKM